MKTKSILSLWKNSIKTKIGITLLFIIIGIIGLFGIYQYLDMKSRITKELNELADLTIIRLAEQLILPLWEVDNLWIRKIVTSEMRDRRIQAILVSGAGLISEGKKRDSLHRLVDIGNGISGDFVIRNRDIIQEDEKIGSVKLYITKKFMINELKRETGTLLLTVILLSVFFIFFLSLMLHKIVIHPINLFRKYAVAIAKGDYGQNLVVSQQDEIGILARGFNDMKENIRQRERELDSARDQLQTVLDAVPATISWIDSDLNYLGVNRKLSGRLAEISKMKGSDFVGEQIDFPGSSPEFVDFVKALFSSDKKHVVKETSCVRNGKNLTHLIIGQKYAYNKAAVFISIDVSQVKEAEKARRQSEEALQESKEKYRHLVESIQDYYFFYTHDTKGIFTYLSPSIEIILGYKPEEFLVHYSEYLTDNPVNKEVERHSKLSIKGEEQPPYELEIFHKDGSRYWLEVKESPVFDNNGNVISIEGVSRNITERKQSEETLNKQLEELQRWHSVTLGREDRIRKIKLEVNELLARLGEPLRYSKQETGRSNKKPNGFDNNEVKR